MKRYKVIDKKAPRYRISKYRYNVLNPDLFEEFKEQNPDIEIDWKDFKTIVGAISEEYIDHVTNNRDGALLPAQLGKLWCGLFPARKLDTRVEKAPGFMYINYALLTGMVGKICWDFNNVTYRVKNYPFYGFIGHRGFKVKASTSFKEQPEVFRSNIPSKDEVRKTKILKKLEYEQFSNRSDGTASDKSGENT